MPDRFIPGYTPLLDEDFEDLGGRLDVVGYLRTHDSLPCRSLGEASDAVRFTGEYFPMAPQTVVPLMGLATPKPCTWYTPSIELAPGLTWDLHHWDRTPHIYARRWDTPHLVEDTTWVAVRMVQWFSRATGDVVHTLAGARMDSSWVPTYEWIGYQQNGTGLVRNFEPPR